MKLITLARYTDNTSIFSGYYTSITACLEHAVEQKIDLSYINLKNQNLTNANLDMAYMPKAYLHGTNLTGCNLSESTLSGARFINTSLYNTCLSYSDLKACNFTGAAFGATLIDSANLRECVFSTLSCFDLDFHLAQSMAGAQFICPNQLSHSMSGIPIVLKGIMNTPIIILDDTIKIGTQFFERKIIAPFLQNLQQHAEIIGQDHILHITQHNEAISM